MTIKKQDAKKSGFSFPELLLCIVFLMNLFVLSGQIFYNLSKKKSYIKENSFFSYEIIAQRIENHFKEVTFYDVKDNCLSYLYRDTLYDYRIRNNVFTCLRENKLYYIIYQIKGVAFKKTGYIMSIDFISSWNNLYSTQIIIYDKE